MIRKFFYLVWYNIRSCKNKSHIWMGIIFMFLFSNMMLNNTKEMIQNVVHQKGYYPSGTPIENFDTEFIEGVLIGAWDDVYKVIVEYETLPWEEK